MKDLSNSESPEIMIVYCNLSSFTLLSQNRYVNRRHDFILVTGKVFGNLQMVVAPTPRHFTASSHRNAGRCRISVIYLSTAYTNHNKINKNIHNA